MALSTRRLTIRQQGRHGRVGPPKDEDSRLIPILSPLFPILAEWKLKTGGTGLLFTPEHPSRGGRKKRPATFVQIHTLHRHLEKTLETYRLPALTWYQATRHTFASLFVTAGGSVEKLSKLMDHSSVTTTERYAHLRADLFRVEDCDHLAVDLSARDPDAVTLEAPAMTESGALSYAGATRGKTGEGARVLRSRS